jgi:hypothetical protein
MMIARAAADQPQAEPRVVFAPRLLTVEVWDALVRQFREQRLQESTPRADDSSSAAALAGRARP